jgi:hypothetical protein
VLGLASEPLGTVRDAPDAQHYRHLLVSAAHRSAPAHNVHVMITRVERLDEDGLTKDTLWVGRKSACRGSGRRTSQAHPRLVR